MTDFFTSDPHINHSNMRLHDSKSRIELKHNIYFDSLEDFRNYYRQTWNEAVTDEDTVYMLGDFALGGSIKENYEYLISLKGKIYFFEGNHDSNKFINYIKNNPVTMGNGKNKVDVVQFMRFKRDKVEFNLSHYPMLVGDTCKRFSIHGHIHDMECGAFNTINVGIDSPLFKGKLFGEPVSFRDISKIVRERTAQRKIERLPEERF